MLVRASNTLSYVNGDADDVDDVAPVEDELVADGDLNLVMHFKEGLQLVGDGDDLLLVGEREVGQYGDLDVADPLDKDRLKGEIIL